MIQIRATPEASRDIPYHNSRSINRRLDLKKIKTFKIFEVSKEKQKKGERGMDTVDVTGLVIASINEILSEMPDKDQAPIPTLNESTRLIGRKGVLDSLGLVSAIVNVEQKLSDDFEILVTIADERAMSQEKSPFRTVESLSEYISILIEEQK